MKRRLEESETRSAKRRLIESTNGDVLESRVREQQLSLKKGRVSTVSIALPGSILMNAQTLQLKSYLAGQIARAATIFKIDEIIIFTEDGNASDLKAQHEHNRHTPPDILLVRLLQFLETPQYLRKTFFPMHADLQYCGVTNPLDAPHHLRQNQICRFREGVVESIRKHSSMINIGWRKPIEVNVKLKPRTRVTVDLGEDYAKNNKAPKPFIVPPSIPRELFGIYWGYQTRLAQGVNGVFSDCPFKDGYDLIIGTSERGEEFDVEKHSLPDFKNLLIVFGGVEGLEECQVEGKKFTRPDRSFDFYLNTCPNQGSGTIRTEEAIFISLAKLSSQFRS